MTTSRLALAALLVLEATGAHAAAQPKDDTYDTIYKALELTQPEIEGKGPFRVGDTVAVKYGVRNKTSKDLRVPKTGNRYDIGVEQGWIERLGPATEIPGQVGIARRGPQYGAGGAVFGTDAVLKGNAPVTLFFGETQFETRFFPPGKYKYTIDFQDNGGKVIQSKSVVFELRDSVPISIPAALKPSLMKRVTVEKGEGTAEELLKKLIKDHELKIEIDPQLAKDAPAFATKKVTMLAAKDVRLDLVIDDVLKGAGAWVIKNGALVLTGTDNPAASVKRANGLALTTIKQPPDAMHTAAVTALKKKLATKVDVVAGNDKLVAEYLQTVTTAHDLPIALREQTFYNAGPSGRQAIRTNKVVVRAAKAVTLDAMLRGALQSVDAELHIDPYGNLEVMHKAAYAVLVPKKK